MYTFNSAAAGVIHIPEGCVPFEGNGCGAGDAGFLIHGACSAVAGKVLGED